MALPLFCDAAGGGFEAGLEEGKSTDLQNTRIAIRLFRESVLSGQGSEFQRREPGETTTRKPIT